MRFEIYKDVDGEWRRRLRDPDGNIIAVSGEGHRFKSSCYREIVLVRLTDVSTPTLEV